MLLETGPLVLRTADLSELVLGTARAWGIWLGLAALSFLTSGFWGAVHTDHGGCRQVSQRF